jgi:hypothetical protein
MGDEEGDAGLAATLTALEGEIAREASAIDDLRRRTHVLQVEVDGWTAPPNPRVARAQSRANLTAATASLVVGVLAGVGLGKLVLWFLASVAST